MHKIYLDGVTRFCETSELSFFKKLGYEEIKDEKPVVKGSKGRSRRNRRSKTESKKRN